MGLRVARQCSLFGLSVPGTTKPKASKSKEMQAVSSSSEDGGGGRRASRAGKAKLSVRDLMSDDFKKAWLSLKDIHDKELHRLQMKLGSMRKARLTEGRRQGPVAKDKRVTETQNAPDSELCERCLINETYSNMLQQEFNNVHQKRLVQIAELTVENNKLKEENRKLSESQSKAATCSSVFFG